MLLGQAGLTSSFCRVCLAFQVTLLCITSMDAALSQPARPVLNLKLQFRGAEGDTDSYL